MLERALMLPVVAAVLVVLVPFVAVFCVIGALVKSMWRRR
jgi:hypothetical protein